MKVSIHVKLDEISSHITPAQLGLIVSWAMGLKHYYSCEVFHKGVVLTLDIPQGASFTSEREIVSEIQTLCSLDPLPCPCGCGAFLVLGNCFRQAGELVEYVDQLTKNEHELIGRGEFIQSIKCIRERLGIGLKDAKDLADDHRDRHFPGRHTDYNRYGQVRAAMPAPQPQAPHQALAAKATLLAQLSAGIGPKKRGG